MATFDIARTDGGSFRWTSKHAPRDEAGNPLIIFTVHHPTDGEKSLAADLGGVKYDDEGEPVIAARVVGASQRTLQAMEMSKAQRPLAQLCIEDVEGLDGWPTGNHRRRLGGDVYMLTEEATALIPDIVLRELATQLYLASTGTAMEGKL